MGARIAWAGAVLGCSVLLATAGPGAAVPPPGVAFDGAHAGALVVSGRTYRLTLSNRNGKILGLVDRATGMPLLHDTDRCLWSALSGSGETYHGGCSFAPASAQRFAYRWHAQTATLDLTYASARFGTATVTLHASPTFFDLRLRLANRGVVRTRVQFPSLVAGDTGTVSAGYVPDVLPGLQLAPAFFSRVANTAQIYPSRWAFADFLALDIGRAHVALYSVARGALHPVKLGFIHAAARGGCSGTAYCVVHEYQTWIRPGTTWLSPIVRIRVGADVEQATLAYRHDNGIDSYPSLASKLGPRLATLAQAPLIKANLQLIPPFRDWAAQLDRLPTPSLLHPVGFQAGGHDTNDPDFLPPDPRFGDDADFRAMIAAAHLHGDLVMPYGNLSWWDPLSPTLSGGNVDDAAVLDQHGEPVTVSYGPHTGVIVSPYTPWVRERTAQYMQDWQTTVPADCVFLDQLGARPWLLDFNPSSPTETAYDDGWLALIAPYRDRCLMVEDGWDRLARDAVGFHGSVLMMSRELGLVDTFFGQGNWRPYPLADWLFHDKVLLYQHDLYDGTMTIDDEVLTWNMQFGLVSSYSWDALPPGTSPWLDYIGAVQRALGPHYAGVALSGYRSVGPAVTESTFGDLSVVANRDTVQTYADDGYDVAPTGFLARTRDGNVVAGIFAGRFDGVALAPGTHRLLVVRDDGGVTVRQVGADTDVAVRMPSASTATALARDGTSLGTVPGTFDGERFVFHWASTLDGRTVAAYRVSATKTPLRLSTATTPTTPDWLRTAERRTLDRVFGGARPIHTDRIWYPHKVAVVFEFDHVVVCGACSAPSNASIPRGRVIRVSFDRRTHLQAGANDGVAMRFCETRDSSPPRSACLQR